MLVVIVPLFAGVFYLVVRNLDVNANSRRASRVASTISFFNAAAARTSGLYILSFLLCFREHTVGAPAYLVRDDVIYNRVRGISHNTPYCTDFSKLDSSEDGATGVAPSKAVRKSII